MTTKKSMVAGVGVVAACTACCTVPIAASAGLVAVAAATCHWRERKLTGEDRIPCQAY